MSETNHMLTALVRHWQSKKHEALAALKLIIEEPMAIAEHTQWLGSMTRLSQQLAEAEDVLASLEDHFGDYEELEEEDEEEEDG